MQDAPHSAARTAHQLVPCERCWLAWLNLAQQCSRSKQHSPLPAPLPRPLAVEHHEQSQRRSYLLGAEQGHGRADQLLLFLRVQAKSWWDGLHQHLCLALMSHMCVQPVHLTLQHLVLADTLVGGPLPPQFSRLTDLAVSAGAAAQPEQEQEQLT